MSLTHYLINTAVMVLLVISCQSSNSTTNGPSVVAIVDEDAITLDEFQEAFETLHKDIIHDNSEDVMAFKKDLLDQLIDHRLLIADAMRLKIMVDSQEMEGSIDQIKGAYSDQDFEKLVEDRKISLNDWKDKLSQKILIQKLTEKVIDSQIVITDQEIEDYYIANRDNFKREEMVRARQIVVSTQEEAIKIRNLILNGRDFSEIATLHSMSPDRFDGGDLGFFSKGEMPEEFDMVFGLKVGEISPVIQTGYGYHIFLVDEHLPARILNPDEAAERIRTTLIQNRRKSRYSGYVADLRQKAKININYSILFASQSRNPATQERPE